MRTKLAILSAAALAAGLLSSQAQVYSANVVGYVNTSITNNVVSIMSAVLDVDGTGTNNTISTVLGTTSVPVGTTVYAFNGAGFDAIIFQVSGHGASATT